MKAYIHTVGGRPFNEECETAQRGFGKLGIECVPFTSNEVLNESSREDVVVGGMLVTGHALAVRGVEPPPIDYPESLSAFLGRRIWKCTIGKIDESDLPLFIKPVNEKELSGAIANSVDDLKEYIARGENYAVWCSELVEFVSEWRFFIRYGSPIEVRHYSGDRSVWPDWDVLNRVIETYADAPKGYAVDLGVTSDGRTLLVEVNDGFALGCYGSDSVAYALLLAARWAELVGLEDELERLNSKGFEGGYREMAADRSTIRILDRVKGASPGYSGSITRMADWMGVLDDLAKYVEPGDKEASNIWRWIANKQELVIEEGPDGCLYMFPRSLNMRYVVDVDLPNPLGYSIVNQFDATSALVFPWVHQDLTSETLRAWIYARLTASYEADVIAMGLKSTFVIMDDNNDDFPDAEFYTEHGYHKAPCKDEEDTARALGAHVIHDYVMEKDLA